MESTNALIKHSKEAQLKWWLGFFAVLVVWTFVYWDALSHMVTVWSNSETYKHCFFIPLISVYLLHGKRKQIDLNQASPVWWLLLPLALGQILFVVVSELQINILMHLSAYCSLVLAVWMLLGHKLTRIILFPLLYLFFAIPFGEELVPFLQEVTADLSVSMLKLAGIPVYREGLYIYLSNGTFHVAEACAGIRFLIGTFAIGVLLAYLNYQKIWKRAVFIALCAVIPVLANGFRAFGIMIIGHLSDMKYATGADHLVYGWFFFAFVLILLIVIGNVGVDAEPEKPDDIKPIKHSPSQKSFIFVLLILSIPTFVLGALNQQASDQHNAVPFINLNAYFLEVREQKLPWAAETSDDVWQGVLDGIPSRLIFVNEGSTGVELVSNRHRVFDNENWTQKELITQSVSGKKIFVASIVNVRGESRTLIAWYQVGKLQSYDGLKVKFEQLLRKIEGRPSEGYFIVAELGDLESIEELLSHFDKLTKET